MYYLPPFFILRTRSTPHPLVLVLPATVSLRRSKAIREEVVWSHWVRRVPKASSFGNPLSGILFGNPFFGFPVKLFGHFRESFFRHFRESSFGNPFSGSFGNPFRESSFGNPFSVLFGNPLSGILFRAFSGILSGIIFPRFRDSSSLKKKRRCFLRIRLCDSQNARLSFCV